MYNRNELVSEWIRIISKELVGRKISGIRYMTEKEMEDFGWGSSAVVIILDNGIQLFPSRDDEGNGAGAIFTTIESLQTIPVI